VKLFLEQEKKMKVMIGSLWFATAVISCEW